MYKVIIVDDEDHIRQGLKTIIDWNACGYEIVGEASNGQQVFDIVCKTLPDVIVTDIKMPVMNGLDMIRQLRMTGYSGYFIIVTGFAEFDYARTAIHHGVKSYLLKPIDERSLVGELYSISKELDKKHMLNKKQTTILNLSKEKLIERFVMGISSFEELRNNSELHQLLKSGNKFQIILLRYSINYEEESNLSDINHVIREFVNRYSLHYLYSTNKSCTLLSIDKPKTSTLLFNQLQKLIYEKFGINLLVSIGEKVDYFRDIPHSYKFADKLFDKQFIYGYKGLVSAESIPTLQQTPSLDMTKLISQLTLAMEYNSLSDINNYLEDCMNYYIGKEASEMEIKTEYINIFISLVDRLTAIYPEIKTSIFNRQDFIERAYLKDSIIALNSELKIHLGTISNELKDLCPDNIVEKIIHYVDCNYNQPITITHISNELHYNRTYIGRKFKNYTGEFFTDYLDKIRVEKAKSLLEKGYKVYQAAEMVGYSSVDYFNNKFKKYEKIPPSQYKKANINNT